MLPDKVILPIEKHEERATTTVNPNIQDAHLPNGSYTPFFISRITDPDTKAFTVRHCPASTFKTTTIPLGESSIFPCRFSPIHHKTPRPNYHVTPAQSRKSHNADTSFSIQQAHTSIPLNFRLREIQADVKRHSPTPFPLSSWGRPSAEFISVTNSLVKIIIHREKS